MTLPQHLLKAKGGVIHIDWPTLPATATVRILDGDGTEQMAHRAANISKINTVITTNLVEGNTVMTVASNTGIACGSTAWLRDDPEEVLVRSVVGATVYLRRPVLYDHVNAAVLTGARIQCNIEANYANALWWDGRAEWNIDGALEYTAVECTLYPIRRLASAQDLFDIEPKLYDVIDRETDVERWLDAAHDMVLAEIAKRAPDERARVFTGSQEFKRTTAAAAMYLELLRPRYAAMRELREDWQKEFESRLAGIVTTTPRDANQDGEIGSDERMSARTVLLRR